MLLLRDVDRQRTGKRFMRDFLSFGMSQNTKHNNLLHFIGRKQFNFNFSINNKSYH